MLRLPTHLSDELEDLIHRVIGCCIRVHRELGPGLLERIYVRAVCVELELADIPFEVEKSIPAMYRGRLLCDQKLDIVVNGQQLLFASSTVSITLTTGAVRSPKGILTDAGQPVAFDDSMCGTTRCGSLTLVGAGQFVGGMLDGLDYIIKITAKVSPSGLLIFP